MEVEVSLIKKLHKKQAKQQSFSTSKNSKTDSLAETPPVHQKSEVISSLDLKKVCLMSLKILEKIIPEFLVSSLQVSVDLRIMQMRM